MTAVESNKPAHNHPYRSDTELRVGWPPCDQLRFCHATYHTRPAIPYFSIAASCPHTSSPSLNGRIERFGGKLGSCIRAGSSICGDKRNRDHVFVFRVWFACFRMKFSRALANIASNLRPARYHVFREPLPYDIGLKLQHDIVDYKLASRDSDQPGQDVILFLGTVVVACYGAHGQNIPRRIRRVAATTPQIRMSCILRRKRFRTLAPTSSSPNGEGRSPTMDLDSSSATLYSISRP